MAFAYQDTTDVFAGGSATTIAITKTFTAGDSAEMVVTWTSSGGTSVTVDNGFVQVGATRFEGNGPTAFAMFHGKNLSGALTITATFSGSPGGRGIGLLRYSGIDTAAAGQSGASNEQSPGVTTADGTTTTNTTPTAQPALLVGFVFDTSYANTAVYTPSTGFTSRGRFASWTSFSVGSNAEEIRLMATTAVPATWTSSNTNRTTSMAMVLTEAAGVAAFNSGWARGANKIIGIGIHA